MSRKLHPTQEAILRLLEDNVTDPLTIREMQDILTLSTPSLVHHHLMQLEKKGYLRRNPNDPQDYQILGDSPERQFAYINVYGLAHCGPNGSILDGKPIDRIPISTKILGFKASEAFFVKAKGDSMVEKIHDGDFVIARRQNVARDGEIVVCVNNGEALIKRLQKHKNHVILVSTNASYPPFIASHDFRVEGVVKGIYAYLQGI
ncbi:MAG TPA: transcriptional repressor LexA [bacterium]|nr:transcriptional repressor LexA [bacterium]